MWARGLKAVGLKGLIENRDEQTFRDFMSDIFAAAKLRQQSKSDFWCSDPTAVRKNLKSA